MHVTNLDEIRRVLVYREIIDRMREAVIANSRGECDTPMPVHLHVGTGEVHIKAGYRRGGEYYAIKTAGTGTGCMLLSSAATGSPVALFQDHGHLTDVRTAAVAAMIGRELGRRDHVLGILGTGIQARLQVCLHAEVLPLDTVWIWGRNPERTAQAVRDLQSPHLLVQAAASPAEVARNTRLVVTATAARSPLLFARDIQPGTHISAVGSDSPGKQELDPDVLARAALLLVDSRRQCEKLGELQHAPAESHRAVEFTGQPLNPPAGAITVCDFTGLGAEDLYIAEYCYERSRT